MKKLHMKRLGLWLTVALCLMLGLCLFVGCYNGPTPPAEDTLPTLPETDQPTEEPIVSDTAPRRDPHK